MLSNVGRVHKPVKRICKGGCEMWERGRMLRCHSQPELQHIPRANFFITYHQPRIPRTKSLTRP